MLVDLVIVGAGPAGCAAAIWAAKCGLSVHLFDRSDVPRPRPGECLHPGVEVLLRDLGVLDDVLAHCKVRPLSRTINLGGILREDAFGSDEHGPWRAIHADRSALDLILRQRARELGVVINVHQSRLFPVVLDGRLGAVEVDGQLLRCSFILDATGRNAWLTRSLGRRHVAASPRMTAFYGYRRGRLTEEQKFHADASGWYWTAQVAPEVVNWTSLRFGVHKPTSPPADVISMSRCGIGGGSDVTWRIAPQVAGPSYFTVGDAALVTDPASGNGVLRALMTGIKAAHNAHAVIAGKSTPAEASDEYRAWIQRWFESDVDRLTALYNMLNCEWQTSLNSTIAPTEELPIRGRALCSPIYC